MRVKRHKIERVREEFAQFGRVCDVVAITGYSRSLVSAVVNGHAETLEPKEDVTIMNSHDMNEYPAKEQPNMENFGKLQYIIDKMPDQERFVLEQYFIHCTSKTEIARLIGHSRKVVDRILRNLRRVQI